MVACAVNQVIEVRLVLKNPINDWRTDMAVTPTRSSSNETETIGTITVSSSSTTGSMFNPQPSGGIVGNFHSFSSYSLTEEGQDVFTSSDHYQSHFSIVNGEVANQHYRSSGESEFFGESCSFTSHYVQANGKVVVDRFEFACSEDHTFIG
jgi:hypothetical protein